MLDGKLDNITKVILADPDNTIDQIVAKNEKYRSYRVKDLITSCTTI
jgi:hypothetical protein